jgi:hypothetical protein
MLPERERYYKQKIVGGTIGGNFFDILKNIFSSGSKLLLSNLPDLAKSAAMGATNTAGQKLVHKLLGPEQEQIKPVLADENHKIISNLITGSGKKKKYGRGMKRII